MAGKLLRTTLSIAAPSILILAVLFAAGVWRRSDDNRWCRNATVGTDVPAAARAVAATVVKRQHALCTEQRQRQRQMFGALWRTGGRATAECGFELARLQLLSYEAPGAAASLLARHGIAQPEFDASSRADQTRFLEICLSNRREPAR